MHTPSPVRPDPAAIHADASVAAVVAAHPATSRTFERHGIDYCCRGGHAVGAAAQARGIDVGTLVGELRAAAAVEPERGDSLDRSSASMTELCDLIERTHHAFLRSELPRARELCARVVRAHGDRHPEVTALAALLDEFHAELESHMWKEETILFPLLRRMDRGEGRASCGVGGPIACMVAEHDDAGEALARMRQLADGYAPPPDACPTFRALYESLASIERDMHVHVHTENWILFPKAG